MDGSAEDHKFWPQFLSCQIFVKKCASKSTKRFQVSRCKSGVPPPFEGAGPQARHAILAFHSGVRGWKQVGLTGTPKLQMGLFSGPIARISRV